MCLFDQILKGQADADVTFGGGDFIELAFISETSFLSAFQ